MTVLLPSPPVRPQGPPPDAARTLDILATVIITILTVAILYIAREILVPIAMAGLLSFVLSPPVNVLRDLGFGKTLSVGIVVCLGFAITVGLGFVLTKQITDLAASAPRYQATVMHKVEFARDFVVDNPVLGKLSTLVADMSKVAPAKTDKEKPQAPNPTPFGPARDAGAPQKPMQVEVVSPPPDLFTILQTFGGAAASPLATAAFVALFIVFILMQREDLRNRFIRIVHFGDLNRTTVAMNEAASRLSRYFLAQVLLNTSFGVVVTLALVAIGVPSAILWGIVAALMRFIPYLGSIGAALFPVLMAAASSQGWTMVIETAILFVTLELLTGQVIEPLVYGHNTGISPIAVVISATFWTWLWGPVGLVLSTPLTVCLVVLGRHVERFHFLNVILGDTPPLTPAETFYQRMLVGDPSEILHHAEDFLREHTLLAYCHGVAMPALLMAQTDARRGALDEKRQLQICTTMRDLIDELVDRDRPDQRAKPHPNAIAAPVEADDDATEPDPTDVTLPAGPITAAWSREHAVVCVAGRTPLDEAAAHILADLLAQHGIGAHVEAADSLATRPTLPVAARPQLALLSLLDADLSIAQARFTVRRLRRDLPDVPIAAAFWMPEDDAARTAGLCSDVRCETCVSSLPQALKLCLERGAATAVADAA